MINGIWCQGCHRTDPWVEIGKYNECMVLNVKCHCVYCQDCVIKSRNSNICPACKIDGNESPHLVDIGKAMGMYNGYTRNHNPMQDYNEAKQKYDLDGVTMLTETTWTDNVNHIQYYMGTVTIVDGKEGKETKVFSGNIVGTVLRRPVGDENSQIFQYADKKIAGYAAMANALAFVVPGLNTASDHLVRGRPTGEYNGRIIILSRLGDDESSDGERSDY